MPRLLPKRFAFGFLCFWLLAISGIMIVDAVYDTLTVPNTKGKMVPYLAQSVTHDPTYTQWTITLRPMMLSYS